MRFVVLGLLGLAGVLAVLFSWWAGLVILALLPLVPVIFDGLMLARVQATLKQAYECDTGAAFPSWQTLRGMVHEYNSVRPRLNEADIATMFMAVQVNSLARASQDRDLHQQAVSFAAKVETVAGILHGQGRLSSAEPMRWVRDAVANVRALSDAQAPNGIQLEPEAAAATRVAQQIAADNASKARLRAEMEAKPKPSAVAPKGSVFDRIDARALAWLKNPYRCESEGMRRASVALSAFALLCWWGWAMVASKGFERDSGLVAAVVLVGLPAGIYLAIMLARFGFLWVIAGFRADAQRKSSPRQ